MIIISIPSLATFECFGFKKAVGFGVVLTGICAMLRGVFGDSYTMVLIVTIGFCHSTAIPAEFTGTRSRKVVPGRRESYGQQCRPAVQLSGNVRGTVAGHR